MEYIGMEVIIYLFRFLGAMFLSLVTRMSADQWMDHPSRLRLAFVGMAVTALFISLMFWASGW
jgi:branched-subunit amino acid transport protein